MDQDFSEEKIKKNCPFCDLNSWALEYKLNESRNFWIICSSFPICEGHILIIPKNHFACVGEFSDELMGEFMAIYQGVKDFVKNNYGRVATFEHGKIGQTIFHSHVHVFPYKGNLESIIPEGDSHIVVLDDVINLKKVYSKEGQYLFLSIGDQKWLVDAKLGKPGFFLARFAKAMGREDRANWKAMPNSDKIMQEALREIKSLQQCWSTGRLAGIKASLAKATAEAGHLAGISAAGDLQIRKTE